MKPLAAQSYSLAIAQGADHVLPILFINIGHRSKSCQQPMQVSRARRQKSLLSIAACGLFLGPYIASQVNRQLLQQHQKMLGHLGY